MVLGPNTSEIPTIMNSHVQPALALCPSATAISTKAGIIQIIRFKMGWCCDFRRNKSA
ncbi:hypothetical protein PILCRDRAFT_819131 [Piloderma croceum F 1598]|uniref:Uncharacterized protein n=1 Tax=Piloderma croceum (strain F 1598) TaxID=765440 RepID=A0A0C3FGM5_PILCF|nr:hypothetical protein PILCRDRAFT_819131 [Piloderma croceum F 1598]